MIRDTLRLNPPPELFLEKSLDDLGFLNGILTNLAGIIPSDQYSGNGEFDSISDAEWQFNQLLTEFSLDSSPFRVRDFPETWEKITGFRRESDFRRKTLEESNIPAETARTEPVVSSAELNGLLEEF